MLAMSISEGRKRLFELRERAVDDYEHIILTHKQGAVVLISMDQWNAWQETERLFRDKRALKALEDSIARHERGEIQESFTVEEVFADLLEEQSIVSQHDLEVTT